MKKVCPGAKLAKWNSDAPVLKSLTSSGRPSFLPTDGRNAVRATALCATASDKASPDNKKARIFNSVLAIAGLEYGVV
jgi:hypothetical protein